MADTASPKPVADLARHMRRYPNEDARYRDARFALLREEIELRRLGERVAAQRRSLPAGGEVTTDYRFVAEDGRRVGFASLFGPHDQLIVYNMMFGPQRPRACPMCTTLIGAWDGVAEHLQQRTALAIVARAPIERLVDYKRERGWRFVPLYSSGESDFNRDYAFEDPQGDDVPALNVFRRQGSTIRHFWGEEMGPETADPGQDPRGGTDLSLLWSLLDLTPRGRGTDWYPSLEYGEPAAAARAMT